MRQGMEKCYGELKRARNWKRWRQLEVKTKKTFSGALPERFDLVRKYSILLHKIQDLPYLLLRFCEVFVNHKNG
jgi:hypothetical protein